MYYLGIFYKKARLDAHIGDLVLLEKPFAGRHVHVVCEYLEDMDGNLTASIGVNGDSISLDEVKYVLLIPIGDGRRTYN